MSRYKSFYLITCLAFGLIPQQAKAAEDLLTSGRNTCIINSGEVKCWGSDNGFHENDPPELKNPRTVSAGAAHVCAIDDDGVKCWGWNNFGQANVPKLNHPKAVAAGGTFTCALDSEGVKCWGKSDDRLLARAPLDVPPLIHPRAIAAGDRAACALDDEGLKCWYAKDFIGSTEMPPLKNPRSVSVGGSHICALDDEGVKCWGWNEYGQTIVPTLKNPRAVSAGYDHACALDDDGVKCWGSNFNRYLEMPLLKNPRVISAGYIHTCALDDEGLKCWGNLETPLPKLEFGPIFTGVADFGKFLRELSKNSYSFDANYLLEVAKISSAAQTEQQNLFLLNALEPYLMNFDYNGIRERYVVPALERLKAINAGRGIRNIRDVEGVFAVRRAALQMLAASLRTSMSQLNQDQKRKADELLTDLANTLSGSITLRETLKFMDRNSAKFEAFTLELAKNPYLRGQAATDLAILGYLQNL